MKIHERFFSAAEDAAEFLLENLDVIIIVALSGTAVYAVLAECGGCGA